MYNGAFVNGSFDVSFCINLLDDRRSWRVALGIWSIIVTVVGVIGNIFTLLAIPYAAQRQRYIFQYLPTYHQDEYYNLSKTWLYKYERLYIFRFGIKKNWDTLQIFVLHLAICDTLYCSIPLPFYANLYIGKTWMFGELWCKMISILAHVFAYVGWMALALIAISRACALMDNDIWKKACQNGGSKYIILGSWVFVITMLLPSFLEVLHSLKFKIKRIRF